jgi:hypothetical protein
VTPPASRAAAHRPDGAAECGDADGAAECVDRVCSLAARVQGALERLYRLDRVVSVEGFVRGTRAGEREALLLKEGADGDLEVSVRLPPLPDPRGKLDLDTLCQVIEGVSHFVYVVERARTGRAATQLELELQAEVDKWVVLAASIHSFDAHLSAKLRARLFEDFVFLHDETCEADRELAERYRVANDVAHRFVRRLERDYVGRARFGELHAELRVFFHIGQEGKLRLGRAA